MWGYGILGKGCNLSESRLPEMIPPTLFGCTEFTPQVRVDRIGCGLHHFAAITSEYRVSTRGAGTMLLHFVFRFGIWSRYKFPSSHTCTRLCLYLWSQQPQPVVPSIVGIFMSGQIAIVYELIPKSRPITPLVNIIQLPTLALLIKSVCIDSPASNHNFTSISTNTFSCFSAGFQFIFQSVICSVSCFPVS